MSTWLGLQAKRYGLYLTMDIRIPHYQCYFHGYLKSHLLFPGVYVLPFTYAISMDMRTPLCYFHGYM